MSKGAPDYSKITLIKGAAPSGDLVTIAVDSSGQILAVLKGDYLGTPTTIAVDANGHMLANIYDPDDLFGNTGYIGLAELAARLGSIMSFDRRGQLVWADGFESAVLKWYTGVGGAGAAVALDTAQARNASQSVKLTAGTSSGKYAKIGKWFSVVEATKLGLELSICLDGTNYPEDVMVDFTYRTATTQRRFSLKWDITNQVLQLWNNAGAWVTVASDLKRLATTWVWYQLKIVADMSTGYYTRLIYANKSVDISATQMLSTTGTYDPGILLEIFCDGKVAANSVCWVDDVILTQNEP